MKQWMKRLAIGGFSAGILLGAAFWGLEISARQAEQRLNITATAFLKKYPKMASNTVAQALNQSLVTLGLDPVVLGPFKYKEFAFESKYLPYFHQQLRQTEGVLKPLPREIQGYLSTQQLTLKKAQNLLLGKTLPVWMFDVEAASQLEFPYLNTIGLFRLHTLFLLQAIAADRNSQFAEREQALAAAWRMQEALTQHPLMRLFTPTMVRSQLGIMRYMDGLSPQWQTRIKAIAKSDQMIETMQLLNWLAYRGISDSKDLVKVINMVETQFQTSFRFIPPSLFRLQNVNLTQSRANIYDNIQPLISKNICTAKSIDFEPDIPWWNTYGKTYSNIFTGTNPWIRVNAMALNVEYTQKILQLKEVAAQQNQWPTVLPSPNSQVCDGVKWQYGVVNGTMNLTLENPEPLTENRTEVIRFTELPYTYSDRL
jgi:hypothetical protein